LWLGRNLLICGKNITQNTTLVNNKDTCMISVLMPVYNNYDYLRESIESILNQTYSDFEFLILDDGSTEPVCDIIKSYQDSRIVLLKNDKNIGLTKSLNICLKESKGDFIARHDSDDISVKDRFEKEIKCFSADIDLVTSYGYIINEMGKRIPYPYYDYDIRAGFKDITARNYLLGASAIFTRKVFNKIGFYDEELYLAQDYNYWIRLLKYFKNYVVSEELYITRKHSKSVRRVHTEYRGFDWIKKCNERAIACPIIN
jgi:glycosyltransferase involved in cell wall biosynthesis